MSKMPAIEAHPECFTEELFCIHTGAAKFEGNIWLGNDVDEAGRWLIVDWGMGVPEDEITAIHAETEPCE